MKNHLVSGDKSRQASSSLNACLEFLSLTPVFHRTWRLAARLAAKRCPAGGSVIEIGCGTGGLTRALAREGFRCTAVEWDAWLLQEAGHHLRHFEASGVIDLLLIDDDHLPLPDRAFDLAVCFLGLNGRSRGAQHAMLKEMRRLAPAVLLLDWQMAERNLHLPAAGLMRALCRSLCDGESWKKRQVFDKAGALEGVLYEERGRLQIIDRQSCLGGSFGLALGRWK